MILDLGVDIYVIGKDRKYHKARLRVREKKGKGYLHENTVYRYLYLAFRNGDTVTEKYIGELKCQ
jgi:hypothetical protein